jgi:hypothetical protein
MPSQRKFGPLAPILAGAPRGGPVRTSDILESRRRAIHAALREAKVDGLKGAAARYAVARKYVLTIAKVEAIEVEGLFSGWPTG